MLERKGETTGTTPGLRMVLELRQRGKKCGTMLERKGETRVNEPFRQPTKDSRK